MLLDDMFEKSFTLSITQGCVAMEHQPGAGPLVTFYASGMQLENPVPLFKSDFYTRPTKATLNHDPHVA